MSGEERERLVDVELFTQMKEEARRLTRETTSRGEDKVGCYQEVWDVGGVDFARDSGVVAGWAVVFEDGAAIRGNPDETEDGSVEGASGSPEVVQGQQRLSEVEDLSQVKSRVGGVADGNDSGGEQCGGGYEIVVRWWWGFGGAKRAHINYSTLKFPSRSFFFNFVRRGGEQADDAAGSAPGNNVIGFAAGE
jgi:hypothetical protein